MISEKLIARIRTGSLLLICFAGVLFLGARALQILVLAMTFGATYEFLSVGLPPYRRPHLVDRSAWMKNSAVLYALLFSLVPLTLLLFGQTAAVTVGVVIAPLTIARELRRFEFGQHEEPQKETIGTLALAGLYPMLLGTVMLGSVGALSHSFGDASIRIVIWFVSIVVLNDTGAYFIGQAFGRTKLAPRVSPNKTKEGALGGLALALLLSIPIAWLTRLPIAEGVLFNAALLISVLSQLGDLSESFVKRLYGVKDMGSLLPGHGGIFDRVDGYLFAAPTLYLLSFCV